MALLGAITFGICFIEKRYLTIQVPALTIFHQITGFVISMVLVFRINTAYDRWWEGRKLWGSLVNNSRNLAIKLHAIIPEDDAKTRTKLFQLISNFPFALKEHLRGKTTNEDIQFNERLDAINYTR